MRPQQILCFSRLRPSTLKYPIRREVMVRTTECREVDRFKLLGGGGGLYIPTALVASNSNHIIIRVDTKGYFRHQKETIVLIVSALKQLICFTKYSYHPEQIPHQATSANLYKTPLLVVVELF